MDSGLVFRVHVGVVRVRLDAALLESGGHGLCILLREDVHDPCSKRDGYSFISTFLPLACKLVG